MQTELCMCMKFCYLCNDIWVEFLHCQYFPDLHSYHCSVLIHLLQHKCCKLLFFAVKWIHVVLCLEQFSNAYTILFFWLLLLPSLLVFLSLCCQYSSLRHLSNVSLSLLKLIIYCTLIEIRKCTLYYFHYTDNPITRIVDFGYHREFSCHTRTCKAPCSFLSFIGIK